MGQLEDIQVFLRVAEAGGISRAAEQLNIAKSAVSRRLNELEERLQTKLIQRTTRQFYLTDAGQSYYQQALSVVESLQNLNESINPENSQLEGRLRLSLPLSFGVLHMTEVLDGFINKNPKLAIQVQLSDQELNLVESGIDIALRIGELTDSSIQARRLAQIDFALCASPQFIEKYSEPMSLEQLSQLPILRYSGSSAHNLELIDPKGKTKRVSTKSFLEANNGEFLTKMAVQGHGYAVMPRFICWQELQRGELIELLKDYKIASTYAYAIYPQNRFLSLAARRFIDYLVEYFANKQRWQ